MKKYRSRKSTKTGLPPATPVFVGEAGKGSGKISVINYDENTFQEDSETSIDKALPHVDRQNVTWVSVTGIHETPMIEKLGESFNLHKLLVEDILNTEHRPKIDEFDDYIYMVVKMIDFDEKEDEVRGENLNIILGDNFVLSLSESPDTIFDPIRSRLRNNNARIRKTGADYLAYSLLDIIVDAYFLTLEKIGDRLESIEEELMDQPTPQVLTKIHKLKREMTFLRKYAWPLREIILRLEKQVGNLIADSTRLYIRDIYDHAIQIIDTIEMYRDILSGMLDIYLSSASNRLGEVMKILTIISTIFIPLSFITGFFGMNFRYMLEWEQPWSYKVVFFAMLTIALSMLYYFRRKKWI